MYNQAILSQVGVSPGTSLLLLNGLVLQEDDMDIFRWVRFGCHGNVCFSCSLLDHLKKESWLLAGLQGLGIPSKYFTQIVSLSVYPQHNSFAVDMRNESVIVSP